MFHSLEPKQYIKDKLHNKSFPILFVNPIKYEDFLKLIEDYYKNLGYELAIDCFIINSNNEVLAQKRSLDRRLFPGCWDFPGGHVESGESLSEGLHKEIKEETGRKVKSVECLFDAVEWKVEKDKIRDGETGNKIILQFIITLDTEDDNDLILEEGKATQFKRINLKNIETLNEGRNISEYNKHYSYISAKNVLNYLN